MYMDLTTGQFLTPGRYVAEIISVKEISAKTGTLGTKIFFRDVGTGGICNTVFWHTLASGEPSKARYRIRILANACGFSSKDLKHFEPKQLIGRRCGIVVENKEGSEYCEVIDVFNPEKQNAILEPTLQKTEEPPPTTLRPMPESAPAREPGVDDEPPPPPESKDGIPF